MKQRIVILSISFFSLSATAALPEFTWEKNVGARPTAAMQKVVHRVPPGPCEAINDAVRALPRAGGTVQLLAGQYDCTSPIEIARDNVRLIGAGRGTGGTVLKLSDRTSKPVLVIGLMKARAKKDVIIHGQINIGTQYYPRSNVKNIIVENLAVDGNRHQQFDKVPDASEREQTWAPGFFECYNQDDFPEGKGHQGLKCDATDIGPAKFIRNNGITVRGADYVTIRNVRSDRALSGGLVTEKRCSYLLVENFESVDSIFDGFAGYETSHSVFRKMRISKAVFSGISIDLGFHGNVFDTVEVSDNGDNGVFSVGIYRNVFRKLTAYGNVGKGVYIEGKSTPDGRFIHGSCDGHRFYSVVSAYNGDVPFRINDACKGIVIEKGLLMKKPDQEWISKAEGAEVELIDVQTHIEKAALP